MSSACARAGAQAFKSRGHWLYAGERPVIHLVESTEQSRIARAGGIDHLAFRCGSLEPFKQKLQTLGIEYQLSRVPDLGISSCCFAIRFGIGVELSTEAARDGKVYRHDFSERRAANKASRYC